MNEQLLAKAEDFSNVLLQITTPRCRFCLITLTSLHLNVSITCSKCYSVRVKYNFQDSEII